MNGIKKIKNCWTYFLWLHNIVLKLQLILQYNFASDFMGYVSFRQQPNILRVPHQILENIREKLFQI